MREKLVELLNDCEAKGFWCYGKDCKTGERGGHEMTAENIADYLAENIDSEWISVKDMLPEVATSHNTRWDKSTDSIRVLCACAQADGKKMVKEGYCKVYSDGYVHWKIPGTIHSVTHWQYLPQPPKGE